MPGSRTNLYKKYYLLLCFHPDKCGRHFYRLSYSSKVLGPGWLDYDLYPSTLLTILWTNQRFRKGVLLNHDQYKQKDIGLWGNFCMTRLSVALLVSKQVHFKNIETEFSRLLF